MQADDWTPEQSQALRDHVGRGMSFARAAAEINARFGTSFTRNAAIGRAKRMGFGGSPPAAARSKRPKAREPAGTGKTKPTVAAAPGASLPGAPASGGPAVGAPVIGAPTGLAPTSGTAALGTPGCAQPAGGDAVVPPVELRCVGISPRLLSLVELEPGDCRYPYGGDKDDEPIAFCGHPRRPGSSYCAPHFHLTRELDTVVERAVAPIRLRLVRAA
jgi:GcrA cell cycle regulator